MWIRLSDIGIHQVNADQLENPINSGRSMVLDLFQREARTVFYISRNKKVLSQYIEKPSGVRIPKRKWTSNMQAFAQEEIRKIPAKKSIFKVTILGWLFLLIAFGILGYLAYKGIQAPAKTAKFQQKLEEKATVNVGDVYFGHFEEFKESESLGRISSKIGFGWFKIIKIENDNYYISKSVEMSKKSVPKEQLNSKEFEQETTSVIVKKLEAYSKTFESVDGHIEFYLNEKAD